MEKVETFNIDSLDLFSNWILFKNPVKDQLEKGKFDKMPKALQSQVLNDAAAMFYNIEVLKVGKDCKLVEPGDYIFITNEIAAQGTFIDNINYILLREGQILGKNVGTQENI